MSVKAMTAVWEHSAMKGGPLLLLLAIADYANDRGRDAYPSIETLARKTRMSPRHVQRMVTVLEEAGELERSLGTGPRRTNEYIVVVATGAVPVMRVGDKMPPIGAPQGRQDVIPGPRQDGAREGDNLSVEDDVAVSPRQDVTPDAGVTPRVTFSTAEGDTAVSPGGRHSCVTRSVLDPSVDPPLIRPVAAAAAESTRAALSGEELDEAVARLCRAWEASTGTTVTRMQGDDFADWLGRLPEEAIVRAMVETGASGSRAWKYAVSILRRYEVEGWTPRGSEQATANRDSERFRASAAWVDEVRRRNQERVGGVG